jgi:hypothetical protein
VKSGWVIHAVQDGCTVFKQRASANYENYLFIYLRVAAHIQHCIKIRNLSSKKKSSRIWNTNEVAKGFCKLRELLECTNN